MQPTVVYDSYWRFASERLAIYYRRLTDAEGPWTSDPILQAHRFTNSYRAADRVSQYLIAQVQYGATRSQAPDEVFFRTMLFKLFNRIDTWEAIESALGPVAWQSFDFATVSRLLEDRIGAGKQIYSAAYIMPSPNFGFARKHDNHLTLLTRMVEKGLPQQIASAGSLENVYRSILAYPSMGPFLAFQYTIDLNYSTLLEFGEHDFVVAGPGALDGISKCFYDAASLSPAEVIYTMAERQESEFARLGLDFHGLFGRRLQPIDCQNLFCEISKYSRISHPEFPGIAGRTRIKQKYSSSTTPLQEPFFPPRWRIG